jgi:hypothetical protein
VKVAWRASLILGMAALLWGGVVLAQALPVLAVLKGFAPGAWTVATVGSGSSGRSYCLADPGMMLTGGREAGSCRFTVHADGEEKAALTWRCGPVLSGRTELVRATGELFTVHVQGLEGGQPFAAREEWRRTGSC